MRYYAPGDETAFFGWLQSIPGVVSVRGQGRELHVHTRSTRLSKEALIELVALYRRYRGNLEELAMFSTPANKEWFDPLIHSDRTRRLVQSKSNEQASKR
jgi:hypothetical protein